MANIFYVVIEMPISWYPEKDAETVPKIRVTVQQLTGGEQGRGSFVTMCVLLQTKRSLNLWTAKHLNFPPPPLLDITLLEDQAP